MINFSLLCIYNKKNILDKFLNKSLDNQKKITYEKKYINNVNNKYKCAKEAFLSELDNLNGEYIIFSHQDIYFNNSYVLRDIYNELKQIGEFGIVGIAGAKGNLIYSNITHGLEKIEVSNFKINIPIECDTLDECLFIVKNEKKYIDIFKKIVADGWHLYAVEYCVLMKLNNEKVYVISSNIYHASSGYSFDNSYYVQLKKVTKKYRKKIKKINTTMGFWSTNIFLNNIEINYRKFKECIKKCLKKL